MEVDLVEEVLCRLLGRDRVHRVRSIVAQDGRVEAVAETEIAEVGVGADPVAVHRLVRGELEYTV